MAQELKREDVTDDMPLGLETAAELADVPVDDLRRAIREGRLDIWKIGGVPMTSLGAIRDMIPGVTIPQPVAGQGYIYVLGFGVYVKIGYTAKEPYRRLDAIRHGLPEDPTVYSVQNGGKWDEQRLLMRFERLRLRGEWFKHEGELALWIKEGCPL